MLSLGEELLHDLRACLEFIRDWLVYTPDFLLNYPGSKLDYFPSHLRVCRMLATARESLRQAERDEGK